MKRGYPPNNFPSLWTNVDSLVNGKRLICPYEVYQELEKQEDELLKWVKQRKRIFVKPDEENVVLVSDIMQEFPKLVNPQKLGPVADPFVIALAIVINRNLAMLGGECIVVSGEIPRGSKTAKIPDVCSHYNVKHFRVIDVISTEGWVF